MRHTHISTWVNFFQHSIPRLTQRRNTYQTASSNVSHFPPQIKFNYLASPSIYLLVVTDSWYPALPSICPRPSHLELSGVVHPSSSRSQQSASDRTLFAPRSRGGAHRHFPMPTNHPSWTSPRNLSIACVFRLLATVPNRAYCFSKCLLDSVKSDLRDS